MSYNGWTNYETWNVALWLDNEEGTYLDMRELARANRSAYKLGKAIEDYVEEHNPLSGQASMYSDILQANLREVNWEAIAMHYLPEEEEDQEEAEA